VAQLRLKLDENLPGEAASRAQSRGADVATVQREGLGGAPDAQIYAICQSERRVLVTLDLDFADVRRYRPGQGPGAIVLRPKQESITAILRLFDQVLAFAETESPVGQLWLVEPGHVRVRG
jgi:predicted nuclease of predicted toxin-antitoxin system